jgi:peptidoglycan L-alanyl-D-glutamate endopeptidase CwlK
MIDPRSAKNLATLILKVQPVFANFLIEAKKHFQEKGVDVRIISGNRTWAEQDALYAKGRTAPGPKVTNAKGGQSNHNYGIAVDLGLFTTDGRYLEESPLYKEIGKVVAKFPELEWGGSWKTIVDEPHVQYRTGLTLAQMADKVKAGQPIV